MSVHSIKTGLGKKYKDMLSAVKGQMCDGYWENTPMMQGYWRFCKIGTAGDEVTIEVDGTGGARVGDRFIENRFHGMSDDAVKKFFADKIKFLIKEEGLGKWDRGNENETDFLSYGSPCYRVKDCYYAYEILKGRDARRHPEYGDVAESVAGEGSIVRRLEDVVQATSILTYDDAWRLDMAAEENAELRNKVRGLLDAFDDAAYANDDEKMKDAAKKLKELADGDAPLMVVPRGESRANEKRVMDTSEPYEISQIKEYMAKKGWTWNFNDKNNHFWFTKDGYSDIEGDLIPWTAYILSKDGAFYFGRSLRNWKADMKAAGVSEAKHEARMHLGRCKNCGHGWTKTNYLDELEPDVRKYFKAKGYPDNADICPKCVAAAKDYLAKNAPTGADEAFDGWDGWEEIEGLEDALDGIENLTYELRSCVRGAKTRCKDWQALARHIQNLASKLDDAAGEMEYRRDDEDESKKKKKNPSKDFSSTVEEDEDGKKKSH